MLEAEFKEGIDSVVKAEARGWKRKVQQKIEADVTPHVEAASGTWQTPFFIMLIGLVALGIFIYSKYKALKKTHLL